MSVSTLEFRPSLGSSPCQETDLIQLLLTSFALREERHPRKGRILLATRSFLKDELLLVENALASALEEKAVPPHLNPNEFFFNFLLAKAIQDSSPLKTATVFSMHNSFEDKTTEYLALLDELAAFGKDPGPPETRDELARLLGICQTNAFLQEPPEPTTLFLFPLAARISHACRSNARFEIQGHSIFFFATHPIEAGDEVTHSYIPLKEPLPVHRQSLHDLFGFWCSCPMCEAFLSSSSPAPLAVP